MTLRGADSLDKSRKGCRIYNTLLDKDLAIAQKRELALRFDLAGESWLAETLVERFNTAIDAYEAERGIQRVKPGELFVRFRGQEVTLPLLTHAMAKQLAEEKRYLWHRKRVEVTLLDHLRQVDSTATLEDVRRFVNRRLLVPRCSDGGCLDARLPDNARLIDPGKVNANRIRQPKPGDIPVPPSVCRALLEFLTGEADLGAARAKAMLDFLAAQREAFCPLRRDLEPGQAVWLAYSVKKYKQPGLQFARRILLPVVLTVFTEAEYNQSVTGLKELNTLQMEQMARVCTEAYLQGALMATVELELLYHRNFSIVDDLLRFYMQTNQVILPTPGTILDAGTAMTHKRIIIALSVQGHFTKEIARLTYHTPEAVDAYLKVFQAVLVLYLYDLPVPLMARVTGRGQALIREHLEIVREHFPDRDAVRGYLREQGLEIL